MCCCSEYEEKTWKEQYTVNAWNSKRTWSKRGSIFRCLLPYQFLWPSSCWVLPRAQLLQCYLPARLPIGLCVKSYSTYSWTWNMLQVSMWLSRCVHKCTQCAVCTLLRELLFSCLFSKVPWQPKARSTTICSFQDSLIPRATKVMWWLSFILKTREVFITVDFLQQDFWSKLTLKLVFDK